MYDNTKLMEMIKAKSMIEAIDIIEIEKIESLMVKPLIIVVDGVTISIHLDESNPDWKIYRFKGSDAERFHKVYPRYKYVQPWDLRAKEPNAKCFYEVFEKIYDAGDVILGEDVEYYSTIMAEIKDIRQQKVELQEKSTDISILDNFSIMTDDVEAFFISDCGDGTPDYAFSWKNSSDDIVDITVWDEVKGCKKEARVIIQDLVRLDRILAKSESK